jgi:hypothetical protein
MKKLTLLLGAALVATLIPDTAQASDRCYARRPPPQSHCRSQRPPQSHCVVRPAPSMCRGYPTMSSRGYGHPSSGCRSRMSYPSSSCRGRSYASYPTPRCGGRSHASYPRSSYAYGGDRGYPRSGGGIGPMHYRVSYNQYTPPRVNYAATRSRSIGGIGLVQGPPQHVPHAGRGHLNPTYVIVSR